MPRTPLEIARAKAARSAKLIAILPRLRFYPGYGPGMEDVSYCLEFKGNSKAANELSQLSGLFTVCGVIGLSERHINQNSGFFFKILLICEIREFRIFVLKCISMLIFLQYAV